MKNRIKGMRTKNHAKPPAPARQIKFKIHVQNRTYIVFKIKMAPTLVTSHEYEPKQYTFTPFKFCKNITTIAAIDMTKYSFAGAHKFFNPAIAILCIYITQKK